ncbi:MAG: valine--tRNA ligase [Sandaracinaceae bacterium]
MATKTIDLATLPPHFDAAEAEKRWDAAWSEGGVYHWDDTRGREETFVVDTPPPTVSGSLHMGHVFSYTHTDVLTRQRRMLGQNIFYPMGWDDNGLPTERRVQNYFHVRCDPTLPYEPGLTMSPADDKKRKDEKPRVVSRKNFIELCHQVTQEDEKAFEALFRRIGLSVDWRQTYATIDDRCRHIAQLSFLDLVDKGHLYNIESPTMWDVDFQTAVAQAEVEDRDKPGAFHEIEFAIEGSDASFVIATTRPELLPACVAVCAHPDDDRFKSYFGKRAVTPIFRAPVVIFPSELADPKKGTGILMVCTFGDATDVHWWRTEKLPLRAIIGRDGTLRPVTFGTEEFPSLDAERANAAYAQLAGKSVAQARKTIVELLKDPTHGAIGEGHRGGDRSPLRADPKPIQHPVKHYEKGERPLELVTTRQWFVRLLPDATQGTDNQKGLLAKGAEVKWWPGFMHSRFHNWTEGLHSDWCVSRQRYFGVPIPVWYPIDAHGVVDYERPIYPAPSQLPVDPMSDAPAGYTEDQRGKPGGFTGDPDVFDTWFTSSLTPQISSHWGLDPARHAKLFPADIRPQSHEIIRTWAFYTIAKAMLHEGKVPWHNVVISGWILDPDRKKMSKSVGNVVTPMKLLDEYTADGVRYWAASARLGMDTAFDEKVLKVGKRLVTKLYNAGKYVLSQTAEGDVSSTAITEEIDRAFVHKLRLLIEKCTAAFAEFEYAQSLMLTEQFFWSQLTDSYLEIVKSRARGEVGDAAARASAVATLRLALDIMLRLFAPIVPYITEEVWSWAFASEKGQPYIHRAPWPTVAELAAIPSPADPESFDLGCALYTALNKKKTELGASVGRAVTRAAIAASPSLVARIAPAIADVLAAAKVKAHTIGAREPLRDADGFVVDAMEVAPKEAKADGGDAS